MANLEHVCLGILIWIIHPWTDDEHPPTLLIRFWQREKVTGIWRCVLKIILKEQIYTPCQEFLAKLCC